MFLLDTSVLTRLRAPSILRRIGELDGTGLARTSMTDLEIGLLTALHCDADYDHIAAGTGQPTE